MKRRTEEEKGRMDSLRNEGKTYREIAEEMGISVDAVNYYPRLWNKPRLEALVAAGRLRPEDFQKIISEKREDG